MKTVIVIGGGASGLMAAVTALKNGSKVVIIEKKEKIGTKLLSTGNGHCNFTNKVFSNDFYYNENEEFLNKAFSVFNNNSSIEFFKSLGVIAREKNGYYYPYSMEASSILNAFTNELNNKNITILTDRDILNISFEYELWKVQTDKEALSAEALIISCGSSASDRKQHNSSIIKLVKNLNHSIKSFKPALTYLKVDNNYIKIAAGVRFQASLRLYRDSELISESAGELQITQKGISGICVFQFSRYISRYYNNIFTCNIDFMPDIEIENLCQYVDNKLACYEDITIDNLLNGFIPHKLILALAEACRININMPVNKQKEALKVFINNLKSFDLNVIGTGDLTESQCMTGGVLTDEINPETMESKIHNGLFFSGEFIDVDGMCGGYNLQWAWTSGYIAGKNASGK